MLPKLLLAFILGGTAVGLVVFFGLRQNPAAPQPVAAVTPASTEIQPTRALPVPPPEPAVAPPAPPAPVIERVPAPAARKAKPVPRAAAKSTSKSSTAPPAAKPEPIPAPPPHIPVIAQAPAPPRNTEPSIFPESAASPTPSAPPAKTVPAKAEEPKPAPAPRQAKTVTIPAGTLLTVRLREDLNSERNSADDSFQATLDAPLIVEGMVIAERGSTQRGRIVELARAGRVKGRSALAIELNQLTTADGQRVSIKTDTFRREAESGVKGDVAKAGVAAGIGAAIGAIAGGGKGAAIGGAIGGAAGAGGAIATRGKAADLPSETRLTFRLTEPVTITEKLN